jgi:sugar transferase (PEP-CTERM/EpsH1 system associated)
VGEGGGRRRLRDIIEKRYIGNMDRPIRIAHVVYKLDVGGLERVVINLMKHMPRDVYTASLYCLKEGGNLTNELLEDGYQVQYMYKKDGLEFSLFPRIAKHFKRERVDIVHCHNYGALFYGAVGSRLARAAGTVYTAHGTYSADRLGRLRFARFVPVDRVVAVSAQAREAMLAPGNITPDRVDTLPNGIDTELFDVTLDRRELKRELGLPEGVAVFGIVARLSPEKQHRILLDAMALLGAEHSGSVLVVVGDGPIRSELEAHAAGAGIAERVLFLGERRDVPRLLQVFDVFVLSSRLEGLSLTLLEAMAAGLPIVATDVGGNSEVVVDGRTGFIVESGDPAALASRMARLAGDPELSRSMGEMGRKRVVERYSLQAMVKRYDTVYHELLESR